MWTCTYCGADNNPSDTLQCRLCGKVDPNATPEELAAWRSAMRAEAMEEERRASTRRSGVPPRVVLLILAALVIGPTIWNLVEYREAAASARAFDAAASCNDKGGPGTPSPPCSTEIFAVKGGHFSGYAERVPRYKVARQWVWYHFYVDMENEDGAPRRVSVLDQPALNVVVDEDQVSAVEYAGKIVGLNGPGGYFLTMDNPDVLRDDRRTDFVHGLIFIAILAAVYILMDVSGRLAVNAARGDHRRGRSRRAGIGR